MAEEDARAFFDLTANHARNALQSLPNYLPLLRRYPSVVREGIGRFATYFQPGLRDNIPFALEVLRQIAEVVPEAREQIVHGLGTIIREEKRLLPDRSDAAILVRLLELLGAPVSAEDAVIAGLARSIVVHRQPLLLVVGAGMSYDQMPITKELEPLLVRFLSHQGVPDPKVVIAKDEAAVWEQVKSAPELFQTLFAGRTTGVNPGPQHRIAASLLREGHLAHIVSFNWDDLIERAWAEQSKDALNIIRQDGVAAKGPALWKKHGDVATFGQRWVFPGESGRVFRPLVEWVEGMGTDKNPPSHAAIIGYSESEPIVQEQLINLLEKTLTAIRVRPRIAKSDKSIALGARDFFESLRIEIELQRKQLTS